MKKVAVFLMYGILAGIAWALFREGVAMAFNLEVPAIGGPDGWKPLVGSMMVLVSFQCYHKFFLWVNKE